MTIHKMHPKLNKTTCGMYLIDLLVMMYSKASKRWEFVTCKRCRKAAGK